MNNEIQSVSFGRYLKAKRLERGISLKVVAEYTRIGLNTLALIEDEDLKKLPEEVFTKGFLRAYAKAVGADGQEAVNRYLSDLRDFHDAEELEAELSRTTTRFWPRLLLSLILLSGVIAGSIYLFVGPQDHIRFFREPSPGLPADDQLEATQPAEKTASPGSDQPVSDKRLMLKVVAVKGTWMKVIIDGQDSEEYKLSAGDHLELQATEGYNILIGDAKGIQLMLNEKPYPITGKSGQVVTVQIP